MSHAPAQGTGSIAGRVHVGANDDRLIRRYGHRPAIAGERLLIYVAMQ